MRADVQAEQTAFAIFRLIDAGVAVEAEVHFPKNTPRAGLDTVPTGFAAAGIQANIKSLCVTRKGEAKCHFPLL